jgi:DNA (cytosine-5)-methyltransferase 1
MSIRFLSLFAGIGGFDLGLERAGWQCVGQVEINPFCRRVLEMHWPNVPRFEDVRTVTGELIRERCGDVDAVVGGFPCQDISFAGKGAGLDGEQSGLWSEQFRILCELRAKLGVMENVAALLNRGMGRVLGDLAKVGYDAEWECIPAAAFGHYHERDRLFIVAYPAEFNGNSWSVLEAGANWGSQFQSRRLSSMAVATRGQTRNERLECEPGLARLVHGVPNRTHRLEGLGNAVVPDIAQWIGERINAALDS